MKKTSTLVTFICASILLITPLLDARGGGGRGGGGGGRGGGGRGGMSRSPSMSRSGSRGPSAGQNRQRPSRPQVDNRIKQNPGKMQNLSKPSNQLSKDRMNNAIKDRTQKDLGRRDLGDQVRNNIGEKFPNRGDWFDNNFMDRHDFNHDYHFGDGNAWKWATWATLTQWNPWGWTEPYYYDYGDYDDDSYVYADTAQEITTSSAQPEQNTEWMSLGVFTFTKEQGSTVTPNAYMQLAVDKNGNISGAYYNSTTDKVYPLDGIVDKETQRAAWMMSDNLESPIMETGIYNLTKDEAQVRTIFADGTTQNGLLIRLKQPGS